MARKKSSQGTASNAQAKASANAAEESSTTAPDDTDATSSETKDTLAKGTSAKGSAKDPVSRKAGSAGKDTPRGGAVSEKAKDSTRSTSVKKAAAAESTRTTGRRVAAATQNPTWLAPAAVVFLVIGLAYLVTYYISAGQLPLPIGDWNLAVGFGVLMVGGGMLMFWK